MKVKYAAGDRTTRWNRWYPSLPEESCLVAKTRAGVFAVGRVVDDYLRERDDFPWAITRVPYYPSLAAAAWAKGIVGHEAEFERFRETPPREPIARFS
jgi:hypothetical protein